jgi:hypothetical protein
VGDSVVVIDEGAEATRGKMKGGFLSGGSNDFAVLPWREEMIDQTVVPPS